MEYKKALEIQRNLFLHIIAHNGEKSAIPMLCEVLHLNKSAVYSRIKVEKLLRIDELLLLAKMSGFHLDQHIFQGTGVVSFQFNSLYTPIHSCREYLEQVLSSFHLFISLPDLRVWFAVNSLLFFHLMNYRELALFKAFAYARLNWQLPYTENLIFNPDTFPERDVYHSFMKPIVRLYSNLSTIEFWPDDLYQTTLKQIRYFEHSGQLKDRSIIATLIEQLQGLCEHQYSMAKQGKKWVLGDTKQEQGGKFDLYHNEIVPSTITLLAESQYLKGVFSVYDDPNFMFSDNLEIYNYTLASMKKLKAKCLHISEDSEQNRRAYFNRVKDEIHRLSSY